MPTEVTNYQCPACTGPLHFDGASGKLKCDYCGSEFEPEAVEKILADKQAAAAAAASQPKWNSAGAGAEWAEDEASKMKAYSCPSCGAQLVCDDTTAATSCPYCGNPTVVPGNFSGMLRPDYILPFKKSKEDAAAALKAFYKGKKLLPKGFAAANHIEEVKGVYVPFWLFDAKANAHIVFDGRKIFIAEHGDDTVTTTRHYRVERGGDVAFARVPVDGSSKLPNAHMDAIEPFDYNELKDFSAAYMPGFLAEKYDVDAQACEPRATERIRNSTISAFEETCSEYDELDPEITNIDLSDSSVKYALLPVWMLSTKWQDKSFLFAMNGQTGRLVGDLPVSMQKFWLWFAGISLPLMAILGLIMYL